MGSQVIDMYVLALNIHIDRCYDNSTHTKKKPRIGGALLDA
jgi:hypothetical protein